jgi:hypothetical protein
LPLVIAATFYNGSAFINVNFYKPTFTHWY